MSDPHRPYNAFVLGFFGATLDEQPDLLAGIDAAGLKSALRTRLKGDLGKNLSAFAGGMKHAQTQASATPGS